LLSEALMSALFNAFNGGFTNPDIERRTISDQKICPSAVDIRRPALTGGAYLRDEMRAGEPRRHRAHERVLPWGMEFGTLLPAGIPFLAFVNGQVPAGACFQPLYVVVHASVQWGGSAA
jgi:hypothetical protein